MRAYATWVFPAFPPRFSLTSGTFCTIRGPRRIQTTLVEHCCILVRGYLYQSAIMYQCTASFKCRFIRMLEEYNLRRVSQPLWACVIHSECMHLGRCDP